MTAAQRHSLRIVQHQSTMPVRLIVAGAVLAISVLAVHSAEARWKAEYASVSPEERAWYERQTTTEETRKRLNAAWYKSCCDGSDTVKADFDKKDGHWRYRRDGETAWHAVPDDAVQPDVQTPHGKPVLFVDQTHLNAGPVCFFPGAAGA